MHIRFAQETDIPEIIQLGKELLTYHQGFDSIYYQLESDLDKSFETWIREHLNHSSQFIFLAENDVHEICGFISGFIKSLYPWHVIKKVGHISFLYIQPAFQKQGLGSSLENEAKQWFQKHYVSYIEVYTDHLNDPGKHAWKTYGYEDFKLFLRKKIT